MGQDDLESQMVSDTLEWSQMVLDTLKLGANAKEREGKYLTEKLERQIHKTES